MDKNIGIFGNKVWNKFSDKNLQYDEATSALISMAIVHQRHGIKIDSSSYLAGVEIFMKRMQDLISNKEQK